MSLLPLPTSVSERAFRGDLDTPGRRLQKLRRIRGLTQEQLAERLHVQPLAVSRWENGSRGLASKCREIAAALGTSPAWLEYGGAGGPEALPVLGYVGAAQEVYPFADSGGTLDEIEAPFGTRPDTRALIVRGDSMLPELGNGDFVLYRDTLQRVDDLVGRRCVVRLADGRVLVKRLRRGTTYGRFTLESTNAAPLEDVEVVAAARVEGVVYR